MAQTLALSTSTPRATGARIGKVGVLALVFTFTTETYTSASGGIIVDLTTILADQRINFKDVLDKVQAFTDNGHNVILTKQATAGQFGVKIFTSGGTEIIDGATTQTVRANLLFSEGGV